MRPIFSLRTRILFFFALFMMVLCAGLTVMAVRESVGVASMIFAGEGVAITEAVVRDLIDPAAFAGLRDSRDSQDPRYLSMQEGMWKKLNESEALFLYTIAPVGSPTSPAWQYVIDGSDRIGGENFSPLGAPCDVSEFGPAFHQALSAGASRHSKMEKDREYGVYVFSIYTPIKNSQGETIGVIGCDFDATRLRTIVKGQILRQSLFALLFAVLGVASMILFMGMIFPRLAAVTGILKSIAEGNGDLTTRIAVNKRDEISVMAAYFNQTLDKIRDMIVLVKAETERLNGIGSELALHMNETAGAVGRITANIRNIKDQALSQSASVSETGATMEQVTANIGKLNAHVEEQSASVAQSSSAIEEMLANIQSVTGTLVKNAGNVRELTTAAEVGRAGLEGVSSDIQAIARESEGLLEINAVIQNIAGQTSLLSMNAAIEAAHAGEAGRGFAVVSGEIRKLAASSAEQSSIISGVLSRIKGSIDKINRSTASALEKFQAIDAQIRTVSQQEEHIRAAMEEQGQGSKQILQAISRLNGITRLVKEGSQDMLAGSQEVISESRNLETMSSEISSGVSEIAGGAEQINAAIRRINEISGENKAGIDLLSREMSQFRVGPESGL
jgi:methyl-accepting chemotaxis protein